MIMSFMVRTKLYVKLGSNHILFVRRLYGRFSAVNAVHI